MALRWGVVRANMRKTRIAIIAIILATAALGAGRGMAVKIGDCGSYLDYPPLPLRIYFATLSLILHVVIFGIPISIVVGLFGWAFSPQDTEPSV